MPDPVGKTPPGSGVYRESMEKYCKKCDTTKSVSEFHKDATKKDGLNIYCRQCRSQASKERYEKNKERLKKDATAWREKNPDYLKKCMRCLENKPKSEFHKDPSSKDGLNICCRQCRKEYYEKNKERSRPRAIESTYGITIEYYNDLLDQQNNCCAVCGGVNENGRALAVDHDHTCCPGKKSCGKCVRGLLCGRCNFMLGNARDNDEILSEGAKYVKRHARPKNLAKYMNWIKF